ncbi:hypothetical protein [Myxococcus sp. AS-1-15]|uniref:hypothetical protein n=1 Tax=Myxococcus sp. AS-1-15 TaxID=2874600 RepID=UPI001CBAE960|nr:hypothetical protein [Myxococcus sp. AS-1-15]MBZ4396817.1 hypothetical protein [Myxococcus sp. AS-1-15]
MSNDRSAGAVRSFLERFLPGRSILQDEFWVPENSDPPTVVLQSEDEILQYLEAHHGEPYGLYWGAADRRSPRQAMVFYTRDGKVILGVAELTERVSAVMQELSRFADSSHVLVGSEQRPPDTASEFIARCRRGG